MICLLPIQSAITAATPWLASAAVVFALMALGARIAERGTRCEGWAQFKRLGLLWQVFIVLSVGSATRWAGAKGDRGVPTDPAQPLEPSIAPVAVYTNDVSFVAATSNAVELTTWRTIGGTEMGAWIESPNAPFFAIGTNLIARAYVSASGAVSFESMRRPTIGQLLPDGTSLPILCPLRTPLGFVPEGWEDRLPACPVTGDERAGSPSSQGSGTIECSRFWHDALPGGGRVFTWENALVDRLPNRRVSMQVEMRPTGDCVFRYDFQETLDPPATNFVIGAQMGTNGVNALSILGTNLLSATVWNVDGAPVTNGVAIADLLCTNGVLRTPATFEIRWRNTSGLDSVTDSDGDGLTDWDEVFKWGTYPDIADTDGDGLTDGSEVGDGTNPLDADENGDGLPDGLSADAWGADTLWATNAADGSGTVTITLNSAIPVGTSATLVVGNLCIPLRSPNSWTLGLVPGQIYQYRLVVGGNGGADLTIGPAETPPRRGPMNEMSIALWLDGLGGAFDGWSVGGSGSLAIPTLNMQWNDPGDGSHDGTSNGVCLHGGNEAIFTPVIRPSAIHDHWQLSNLDERNGKLVLSVPDDGVVHYGSATRFTDKIRFGVLQATVSAHHCDSSFSNPYCSFCDYGDDYHGDDLSLSVRSPLTLKHDNQSAVSISHPNSMGTTIDNATVQIRRKNESAWLTLGSPSSLNPWTAKIAGTFEMRGIGTVDGKSVETPIAEVEVRFPSISQIMSDQGVQSRALQEWNATLADCTEVPNQRREHGYWIMLDTQTETYSAENLILGGWATPGTTGAVVIPNPPPDRPISPNPIDSGAIYSVAWFHTHTPTTYLPTNNAAYRPVGPSNPADYNVSLRKLVPGIAYDFDPDPVTSALRHTNAIPCGWPKSSPAHMYSISPPLRRNSP